MEGKTPSHPPGPPVVVLAGPTAVGKSDLALRLARHFPFDIVTADSRQVYRYMDIGTAKPTRGEQAETRHYMIDLAEPDDVYSAQRFAAEGRRVLARIAAQGRMALVAGGTGFYMRSLLDGHSLPEVPPDPDLRRRLGARAETEGAGALHADLAALDPVSADRIHPNNVPRVVRALEIVYTLGGPVPGSSGEEVFPALYLGLTMPRAALHRVADARVHRQIAAGLVEETETLLEMGYGPDVPALQGFGYREMVDYLQGRASLADATEAYKMATHRYIRRQMTWFRADRRMQWIEAGAGAQADALARIQTWLATDESGSS